MRRILTLSLLYTSGRRRKKVRVVCALCLLCAGAVLV